MSFLPSADRRYLQEREITFREITDGAQKGVILPAFALPADKYQVGQAEILILIPAGYSDVAPDMFHALPWLQFVPGNRYPKAADQPVQFDGRRWQRWSRHNRSWRSGVDGLWTMLKRVEQALEEAA